MTEIMDLSKESVQELNIRMAGIVYPGADVFEKSIGPNYTEMMIRRPHGDFRLPDWVNDRNLWSGLMVDMGIGFFQLTDKTFTAHKGPFSSFNADPGRAVVETCIKMNEERVS